MGFGLPGSALEGTRRDLTELFGMVFRILPLCAFFLVCVPRLKRSTRVVFRMLVLEIVRLVLAVMLSLIGILLIVSTHRYSRVLVDLGYVARIKPAVHEFFKAIKDATGRISCLPHFRRLVRSVFRVM